MHKEHDTCAVLDALLASSVGATQAPLTTRPLGARILPPVTLGAKCNGTGASRAPLRAPFRR